MRTNSGRNNRYVDFTLVEIEEGGASVTHFQKDEGSAGDEEGRLERRSRPYRRLAAIKRARRHDGIPIGLDFPSDAQVKMLCIRGEKPTNLTPSLFSGSTYEVSAGWRCCCAGRAVNAIGTGYRIDVIITCIFCHKRQICRAGDPVEWDPRRFIPFDPSQLDVSQDEADRLYDPTPNSTIDPVPADTVNVCKTKAGEILDSLTGRVFQFVLQY